MRTVLVVVLIAALVWVVLTLANELADIEVIPDGGLFKFPEIRFDRADELVP